MNPTANRIRFLTAAIAAMAAGTLATELHAIDVADTRLLSQPAVSADHVAFAYAGDLWIAGRDGSGVRRLTSHEGTESRPRFSPDGSLVTFSAEYDGNVDVFVIPAAGGEPKRLTWHPGADVVQGFTVDGSAVLFASQRSMFTNRHFQLFTVPLSGGLSAKLPIPHGAARQLLARRPAYRLHPHLRALPAVEELPRRHDVTDLDLRHRGPLGADDPPTRGPLERHESDLDRQPGLLPVRPGRRVQPLLLRHGQRRDRPALRVRGLPCRGPLGFHGHGDLRAGGLPAPLRSGLGPP